MVVLFVGEEVNGFVEDRRKMEWRKYLGGKTIEK